MSAIFGETLAFGQENGPEVQLVVFGDEFYARYETPDGYAVVYDSGKGLFCYATLHEGTFQSSGVPLTEKPPTGLQPHAKESDHVRQARVAAKIAERSPPSSQT